MKTLIFFMMLSLGFGMRIGSAQAAAAPLVAPAPPPVPAPMAWPQGVPAGQTVEQMPWNFVPPLPPSVAGNIEAPSFANDLSNSLEIGYSGPAPLQVKLRTVPYTIGAYLPPVTTHHYAIVGEVRYENVAAGTYLEMWSHFASSTPGAPDESYFTRTLGDSGPMGKLEGTHDWRGFYLPFDSTGAKGKLTQLDFNIHFAGYGDVHLANMRLVQYPDSEAAPLIRVPTTSSDPKKITELIVQITSNAANGSSYSVDGVSYASVDAIKHLLAARHETDPSLCLIIRADKSVTNPNLAAALENACRDAGIPNVFMANTPDVAAAVAPPITAPGTLSPTNANTATMPEGELMTYLLWWENGITYNDKPSVIITGSDTPASWLSISRTADTPLDLNQIDAGFLNPLQSFSNIIPTPRRYGLIGQIEYEDVAPGSYLEMRSYFSAPSNPAETNTPLARPPSYYDSRAAIEGSSSGRLFSLPLDSTKIPGKLVGLSFNIHFAGRGKLIMRDVKTVRYDEPLPASVTPTDSPVVGTLAPAPVATTSEPASRPPSLEQADLTTQSPIHWKSFLLGVAATGVFLLAGGGIIFISRRWNRRRHEREMRRIASLDS